MKKSRVALAVFLVPALTWVCIGLWAPQWLLQAEFARQRWVAGAETKTRQAAGFRWNYLQAGDESKPLVVLVHGFTGSKENWLPVIRQLSTQYRVIAPDLPGWGESERRAMVDYGPVAQAMRLDVFLKTLPRKPVMLVGHSMGGQIVGLLAARDPQAASRYVLMSSAGVRFKENQFGREVLAGQNPFEAIDRAQVHRYLGIVFTDPPFVPWPVDEAIARRRRADAAFEQSVLDRIGRGPQATQLQDELAQIKAPVLLLWCKDDRVIDVSSVPIFQAGLPDSHAVLFEGCGHMPMMAKPGETAAVLEEFAAAPAP